MTGPDAGGGLTHWLMHLADDRAARAEFGELGRALVGLVRAGQHVPPAFALLPSLREETSRLGELPPDFDVALDAALLRLERETGARRDDPIIPLLVDLFPDGVGGRDAGFLRLGLSPLCLDGLVARTGDPAAADRTLRELVVDFAVRVNGVARDAFEDGGPEAASALALYELLVGTPFPTSLAAQLRVAVEALLETERLRLIRRLGNEAGAARGPGLLVTATVLPGAGAESGAGTLLWSDHGRGVTVRFRPDDGAFGGNLALDEEGMRRLVPAVAGRLDAVRRALEVHPDRPAGIEFVAEAGELFLVGVAGGAEAADRDEEPSAAPPAEVEAAGQEPGPGDDPEPARQSASRASAARGDSFLDDAVVVPVAHGRSVAPGAGFGRLVFDATTALHCHRSGLPVVLVRAGAGDSDLRGLAVARALLIAGEGVDDRCVVVAARMGLPTLVLEPGVHLDERAACLRVGELLLREGDPVTVDADAGRLFLGQLAVPDGAGGEG